MSSRASRQNSDGDNDVFGRLAHMLETESFYSENQSTLDLVKKINDKTGTIADTEELSEYPTITASRDNFKFDEYDDDMDNYGSRPSMIDILNNQSTPTNHWDAVANDFNAKNRTRLLNIQKKQNEALRSEMQGVTFVPHLSDKSLKLTSNLKPLKNRLKTLLEKKEKFVNTEKLKQQEEIAETCTFKPNMMSRGRSSQILGDRHGSEFIKFNEWKTARTDKKRHELEEMEMRDVTHAPMLARASLQIQQRLVESGKIQIDPQTRQTISTSSKLSHSIVKGGVGDKSDPGHGEESFAPNITTVGASYNRNTNAFNRLYSLGVEKAKKQHEANVSRGITMIFRSLELYRNQHATSRLTKGISVMPKKYGTKTRAIRHDEVAKSFMDQENKQILTLEFDPNTLEFVWDSLLRSFTVEPYSARTELGPEYDEQEQSPMVSEEDGGDYNYNYKPNYS